MNKDNNMETVSEINNQTNDKIYDRNIPSNMLQPYFSLRPTHTKYTKLMTTNQAPSNNVPLISFPQYNAQSTFYPANATAPWSGFSGNIDIESDMRNQFFALQSCPQAVYVPSSSSDLYTLTSFTHPDRPDVQSHPLLFKEERFDMFNPNITNNSNATFNNHTRQDIKNTKL